MIMFIKKGDVELTLGDKKFSHDLDFQTNLMLIVKQEMEAYCSNISFKLEIWATYFKLLLTFKFELGNENESQNGVMHFGLSQLSKKTPLHTIVL